MDKNYLTELKMKIFEPVVADVVGNHFDKSLRETGSYDDAWDKMYHMSINECHKFVYLELMKVENVGIGNLISALLDNSDIKHIVSVLMDYAMDGKYKRLTALGILNQEGEYVRISA